MWIDHGVYPDYMTFTYSPYYMGETRSEKLSKRKSDEDDLKRTLENLNKSMLEKGFPPMKVFITSWNMTNSSRNYFNDSLWKACYIIKCCIESLGKVDGLLYSQLQDSVTDYYDNQQLLNGSGGLLTRDWIAKPAFLAYRLLRHLQKYFVASGDNYIITRDDYGKITIVMHNFIARNYLYYLKEENENTLKDHYSYFVNQNTKNLHFELEGVEECISYELHHHVVNRKSGSIMDEWAKYEFNDNLHIDDIDYLKAITMPSIYTTKASPKEGKLIFDVLLEPLEVRCISLRPMLYT
jgi:xylan 1,4-beta-xylosidase